MIRFRRTVLVLVVAVASVLAVVFLAGCGGSDGGRSAGAGELDGTWVLDQVASGSPDFGVTVTVDATFADGTVSGTSGCNRYSAGYTTEDPGSLSVGPVRSTKMMCTPEAAAIESDYLDRLAAAESYSVGGGRLRISGAGGAGGADLVYRR